ncbi:MAG TPA: hypothetical protein VK737_06760 [Opitutales bacterium]|jgi:hypothetical protein|nr:hypothetical protein [Opitutales bacterium]
MRAIRAVLALIFFAGVAHAASAIYDSPAGGFAFTPPAGWAIKSEKGEVFPTLYGPADDLSAPYVVIQAIHDPRDLFDLGDATIKAMLKDPHYTKNGTDGFATADKQFGMKCVLSVTVPQTAVAPSPASTTAAANRTAIIQLPPPTIYRQVYYFVPGPAGTIYAFLATVPDAGWKKYEPLLDVMMQSYHLRPVVAEAAKAMSASSTATAPAR